VSDLGSIFGPTLVAAIERLVDERLAEALAQREPTPAASPWLTVEQAAVLLGCSQDAVRMRINRGRLQARRQGRRVYVSRRSVVELD
jgi:excisionase family DNA binding protein